MHDDHNSTHVSHPDENEAVFVVRVIRIMDRGRQGIREVVRLRRIYGRGRWRKRKGIARIKLSDGTTRTAEVHWYEAHGIGRKEVKIKRFIS